MAQSSNTLWEGRTAAEWQDILQLPAVYVRAVTASTNDDALALAEAGAESLTLVIADHQTSGRGRNGTDWLSVPGSSLLCSFVFQTLLAKEHAAGAAPIRIGGALAEAIERLIERPVGVKWPNDIVGRDFGKFAGILCEGAFRQEGRGHIVAGIGVNAFYPGDDYAALADMTDEPPTRAALLQSVVRGIAGIADRLTEPLRPPELNLWRARDVLFGEMVSTESGITGRAAGITADGSLLIETATGMRAVQSATIRLAETGAYPGSHT